MSENITQEVLEDALKALEKAIRAINSDRLMDLEAVSNETIHNASIAQDVLSTTVSKILLGIFKLERHSLTRNVKLDNQKLADDLIKLHDFIGLGRVKEFSAESKKLIEYIEKTAAKLHLHNVIDSASVDKGGKVYDHGISLAQAAETMKVSQWELYPYVGKSKLNDYAEDIDKRVKQRIAYTRGLFK